MRRGEARVSLRNGCESWVEGEGWRRGEGGIAFVSWMEVDLLLLMDAERKRKRQRDKRIWSNKKRH